jgi:peptidoglycan/LPS O-acetylase OafA/YrhL
MKLKKIRFAPIPGIIGFSVAALIAWAISHWTDFPFWGAFAIVIGAMIVNGIIAGVEDNAPGGFNNPHPPKPKKPDDVKPDA